jgi:hypothetical protein
MMRGLYNLYSSQNIRMVRLKRIYTRVHARGDMRNPHTILAGKAEGKRPLCRAKRRWEDNVEMNLKAFRAERVDGMLSLRIGHSGGIL